MIVFNAFALIVAIICGIFLGPLYWAFPVFMDTTWGDVLACGIVAVVSIISDLIGLKGRVFFLPIWLFALIGVGVNLHELWGWYGPALAGVVVVLLFIGLMMLGTLAEKKEWAEAPNKLNAARDSLVKGLSDETWELLSDAYFVPSWGNESPEACRHNLEVLEVVKKAAGDAPGLELRLFDALGVAYRAGMAPKLDESQKTEIPNEFTSAMQELLQNKGRLPPDEDRKDLVEALNKAALPAATT